MEMLPDRLAKMSQAEIADTVLRLSKSDVPGERLQAIVCGTKYRAVTQQFLDSLEEMAGDDTAIFFGTPISSFAKAALDVLGVREYTGEDRYIHEMIESGFQGI